MIGFIKVIQLNGTVDYININSVKRFSNDVNGCPLIQLIDNKSIAVKTSIEDLDHQLSLNQMDVAECFAIQLNYVNRR